MAENVLNLEHIEIGTKIKVEIAINENKKKKSFTTTIIDKLADGCFVFDVIKNDDIIVELTEESTYIFTIYLKEGVYKNKGKVTRYLISSVDNRTRYPAVEFEEVVQRTQRRENFRMDCRLFFEFKKNTQILATSGQDGVIIDLSAGGIKFLSNIELQKREIIEFSLILNGDLIFLEAEIMYIDECNDEFYNHQYRCKLNNVLDSDKDNIIQYILDEQRGNLKRKKFSK